MRYKLSNAFCIIFAIFSLFVLGALFPGQNAEDAESFSSADRRQMFEDVDDLRRIASLLSTWSRPDAV
jgi:hypothetical protein